MSSRKNSIETELADRTGVSTETVSRLLDALAKLAYERASGVGFELPGFGIFVIEKAPDREGIHPVTKEPIVFPGRSRIEFVPNELAEKSFVAGKDVTMLDPTLGSDFVKVLPQIRFEADKDDVERAGLDVNKAAKANTKLGGEPFWIQDPEEVVCCGRPAVFYGQFDSRIGGDFNILDAGTLYVFLCNKCWTPRGIIQFY